MKKCKNLHLILAILMIVLLSSLSNADAAAETHNKWVARVVSVQGSVQAQRSGETQWISVKLNDTYRSGDMIRVQEKSRAAIVLQDETILRLDQNTTIVFSTLKKKQTSLIKLIIGAVNFFSRFPTNLKVITPFVNASIEGTEFFVKVDDSKTFLSVFKGRVLANNELGSITMISGQSSMVKKNHKPTPYMIVHPRDSVQWALYYPHIFYYSTSDFPKFNEIRWQKIVRKSIEAYWDGDLTKAFSILKEVPKDIHDPRFFTYCAALLLSVGRVDEAKSNIQKALIADKSNSLAFSLQSIIAVAQNNKDKALILAEKAVKGAPNSIASQIALSYARQAGYDLQGALACLQKAVAAAPDNALAQARLAELYLSEGDLDRAVNAAQRAVSLNPNIAHSQTVLGFAYLTQIKTKDSKNTFKKAIELDQAAPLPRLGLGLAKIREGDLKEGRSEIEIAVSLDPDNSLMRSYLGKAYFEEKRDKPAMDQFSIAKKLDPLDPTSYFYDAIRNQTKNRPVEALHNLQKSIELNDNRAVYRSRLMLDQDLAARSAGLARIYGDLGFNQLALVEGWKSLSFDQGNYSAHRFLADSYSALPRHEIARVSELLQSQLLQPINITPVQPQLAESNLFILEGAGPTDPSFTEFNPLFNRNRFALQGCGVIGGNQTIGDEIVLSAVLDKFSYSLGQFHYKTDGFRENNDLEQNIYNAFAQINLNHKTSIQGEFRYTESEKGDLEIIFNESFTPTLRQKEQVQSTRLGFHHAFTPRSDIIASFNYQNANLYTDVIPGFFAIDSDVDHYTGEVRYLFHSKRFNITGGAGHRKLDGIETTDYGGFPIKEDDETKYSNLYLYSDIDLIENLSLTIGGSGDFLKGESKDEDCNQFNPKFGLIWSPAPATVLRAAAFRTLQRPILSRQNADPSIEPTQVAGFNQFFFGAEGDKAWRYGLAVDHGFSYNIYVGAELSFRDLDVVFKDPTVPDPVFHRDWEERMSRAYLYWTPFTWLSLSAEYLYERFERDVSEGFIGVEEFEKLRTHRIPIGIRYFHPCGFSASLKATYLSQEGNFIVPKEFTYSIDPGDDQFWIIDTSISYRLPKRYGLVSVVGKNLLNEEFNFQDTDPGNPRIAPDRLILLKLTLSF
ncbi:MAG: TonB-dependent receptor [Thermodesulfobacteriota bacterium]|nr:TonB-dependent receptor [Thermodesulfobacteriota bacterium]